jgi:hypothetical protein
MLASANDNEAAMAFAAINRTLKDDQATLTLYDQLPADDKRRRALASAAYDQLLATQRYADAAQGRPYASMSSVFDFSQQERPLPANTPDPERLRKAMRNGVVTNTTKDIEVLAGSGDLEHARALAAKLLAFDGSDATKATLQEHLTRAGQPGLLSEQSK